jgi:hypothetical protein
MTRIVLLALGAAWAAVLLPPLLRNRSDNRPGSSVSDFRRNLTSLQRAVPTRSISPARSMARPLAPSPLARPAATGRPQAYRTHGNQPQAAAQREYTGELQRRHDRDTMVHGQRHQRAQSISRREVIRRRRTNVLFLLVMATVLTVFLAATMQSSVMVYAFAFSFVSLCGYCYKLAQIRQYEPARGSRAINDPFWHAA